MGARRRPTHRRRRLLSGVLTAAAIVVAAAAFAPDQPAEAVAGYRVCGVHGLASEARGSGPTFGSGLVVKVLKGGRTTCQQKLTFMRTYYGLAYSGARWADSFEMSTCEELGAGIGLPGWDPCGVLTTNKVYKFYSRNDLYHPVTWPSFVWWTN